MNCKKIQNVFSRTRSIFSAMLAVSAVSALMFVGCGKDDDDNSSGGGNITCADGEAWVNCEDVSGDNYCDGLIFRSNKEYVEIYSQNLGNSWKINDVAGTWSTSGSTLTITYTSGEYSGDVDRITYNVSGNNLTFSDGSERIVWTKRSGVNVSLSKSREGDSVPKPFFKR